jgi:uncharacterized protein YdhG (YjbR/CyaY superfamily)
MAGTKTPTKTKKANIWSEEERAAMREADRKRPSRRDPDAARAEGERDVLAKIAGMSDSDRAMAERIHALMGKVAPTLVPRTFYGMPAYAKDGKVLCFFKPASTYKERYATFGFQDNAQLDDGRMWPTSWALTKLTDADESTIAALVKKAVG